MKRKIAKLLSPLGKLGEEKGIALITVIGLLLVLTIIAVSLLVIGNDSLTKSGETRNYTRSLNIAESGLERVLWNLREHGIRNIDNMFPFTLTSADLGTEGTTTVRRISTATFFVKVVSVGEHKRARRGVECVLFSSNIWEMNFAGGTQQSVQTGASGITGSAEFIGPLFVRGNFPVGGNTSLTKGPLFIVGGSLIKESAGGNVGTSDEPVEAYITGTPPVKDSQGREIPPENWPNKGVYINPFNAWAPEIILPTLDVDRLDKYRLQAFNESIDTMVGAVNENTIVYPQLQSVFPTLGSGRYKVFDGDGSNSALGNGNFGLNLTNDTTSFGLYDTDNDMDIDTNDSVNFEFGWFNPAKNPMSASLGTTPTVYVKGTVFIDGPLTIGDTNMRKYSYQNFGTLVVNGNVTIRAQLLAAEFPTMNALGLVSAKDIRFWYQSANDDQEDCQGAFFALGDVYFKDNYFKFKGTIIGNQFICDAKPKLEVDPLLPNKLPPSLPGNPQEDGYLSAITSWREIAPPW